MLKSDNPTIKRILGVTPGMGKALGVDEKWVYNIVKQVGNYGEVFDRNLGTATRCSRCPRRRPETARWSLTAACPLRRRSDDFDDRCADRRPAFWPAACKPAGRRRHSGVPRNKWEAKCATRSSAAAAGLAAAVFGIAGTAHGGQGSRRRQGARHGELRGRHRDRGLHAWPTARASGRASRSTSAAPSRPPSSATPRRSGTSPHLPAALHRRAVERSRHRDGQRHLHADPRHRARPRFHRRLLLRRPGLPGAEEARREERQGAERRHRLRGPRHHHRAQPRRLLPRQQDDLQAGRHREGRRDPLRLLLRPLRRLHDGRIEPRPRRGPPTCRRRRPSTTTSSCRRSSRRSRWDRSCAMATTSSPTSCAGRSTP